MDGDIQPIPREDYERLIHFLQDYNPPAILPIQIAYYAGLRIGEACGLAWQDVNLEEQCLQSDEVSAMMVQDTRTSSDLTNVRK